MVVLADVHNGYVKNVKCMLARELRVAVVI